MRLYTLRRSAATTSFTSSTSWRGQCPKPSKAQIETAKHLLRYLAGSTDFSITYKQEGFKLAVFSDAHWGVDPNNGKSTSSYIIMLSNGPISFKVGIQGLTTQSTMEAELVAAPVTMKETVFCSSMMLELGFKEWFGSVPLYIDNTSALHVSGNRRYNPRAKHIALRYFFVQELVEEGKITIHLVKKTRPNRRSRNQARQQAPSPCPHQAPWNSRRQR